VFDKTTSELQDQDRSVQDQDQDQYRFFGHRPAGLLLKPTVSDHITGRYSI